MNEIYKKMSLDNGEQRENIARNYKEKLKNLLLEFIPEVIFFNQRQKKKLEQIITKVAESEAVGTFNDSILVGEDFQTMWKFQKCIRADV